MKSSNNIAGLLIFSYKLHWKKMFCYVSLSAIIVFAFFAIVIQDIETLIKSFGIMVPSMAFLSGIGFTPHIYKKILQPILLYHIPLSPIKKTIWLSLFVISYSVFQFAFFYALSLLFSQPITNVFEISATILFFTFLYAILRLGQLYRNSNKTIIYIALFILVIVFQVLCSIFKYNLEHVTIPLSIFYLFIWFQTILSNFKNDDYKGE